MSERHACRPLGRWRATQRYLGSEDEDALTRAIIEQESQYGVYGYRRIAVAGRWVAGGQGSLATDWRREGLKVPRKQRPRGRL
jgi:hypothetical protein